jgi:leucyl aminopeptidase (aminopeptidase T)
MERAGLVVYPNARRNNADLPETARVMGEGHGATGVEMPMSEVLSTHQVILAPTELSATAPLKLLGKRYGFRAATMPQFNADMIPALRLDWVEIDGRCRDLKALLDEAEAARIRMETERGSHELFLDLRHRTATASGGMMVEEGQAGNLPSGETFIVPYEGEIEGDPSRTAGMLPIELRDELLYYRVEGNRIVEVIGDGQVAAAERAETAAEPAYCNIAELGLGLLKGYGIQPTGSILLDEKLGLHIAFGRSDHFGGQVGVKDFTSPEKVIHIDRVYIPEVQPQVRVRAVDLEMPGGDLRPLMRDGDYV